MADQISLRRDTEANWIEADPVLAQGEHAITLDDLATEPKFKIGDGLALWSELPYFGGDATGVPLGSDRQIPYCDIDGLLKFSANIEYKETDNKLTVFQPTGSGYSRITLGDNSNYIKMRTHDSLQTYLNMYGVDAGISVFRVSDTATYPLLEFNKTGVGEVCSINYVGKIKTTGGLQLDIAGKGVGKYLVSDIDGNCSFIVPPTIPEGLPVGTSNKLLRHSGTGWVPTVYSELTDTSTSSKLTIVNGTSPTLKSAELYVTDSNSALLLQTDVGAPSGGQQISAYTSTTAQAIDIRHEANEFISIYSSTSSKYISMRGGTTGEQVVIESKKTPSTTNQNIVVRNNGVDNFYVQNNGKTYQKQHPQIDTTEAATGKILVCTDNDGNSQWQTPASKGLEIQSANLNMATAIAFPMLRFAGLATKKYRVEYYVQVYNGALSPDWIASIDIDISNSDANTKAFGTIEWGNSNYNSSFYLNDTNDRLIDFVQEAATINVENGIDTTIFRLNAIVTMGASNGDIDFVITPNGIITPTPYVSANSWCRWEEF